MENSVYLIQLGNRARWLNDWKRILRKDIDFFGGKAKNKNTTLFRLSKSLLTQLGSRVNQNEICCRLECNFFSHIERKGERVEGLN